ncbi:MAG: hypothetical protein PHX68_03655 [Alphaproteobacteria bacterium]|nr:hypothetical protein [Alphaproteobacteria bacterium]
MNWYQRAKVAADIYEWGDVYRKESDGYYQIRGDYSHAGYQEKAELCLSNRDFNRGIAAARAGVVFGPVVFLAALLASFGAGLWASVLLFRNVAQLWMFFASGVLFYVLYLILGTLYRHLITPLLGAVGRRGGYVRATEFLLNGAQQHVRNLFLVGVAGLACYAVYAVRIMDAFLLVVVSVITALFVLMIRD